MRAMAPKSGVFRPQLEEKVERRWTFSFPVRTWALAGSIALLLVLAFWAEDLGSNARCRRWAPFPPLLANGF